jgi:Cd2+/Zn2+-exporting ATPase
MSSSRDHERERPPPDGPANDAPGDGDVETARFEVPEMDCASCAGTVEAALDAAEGVADRDAVPATGRVTVTYDSGVASVSDLVDAIDGAGYEVTDTGDTDGRTDDPESVWRSPRAVTTWVGAALLVGGLVSEFMIVGWTPQIGSILGSELHLADALFLGAVAVSGQAILKDGYYSAGALAASLGFGAALYFEAATLAVLFSVAELLERHSMDRARDSLRELLDLSPEDATVKRDGSEETVPVDAVSPDDVVVVRPGGKIPADGEVVAGDSAVNQSPITGESVPVDKTPGDEVYAGTLVENGYLEVRVTAAATDTTLSRIVALVEDAGSERTDREQFVERFSSYYTPVVVAFAVVVSVSAPLVFGVAWPTALVYGLTLLVLACPCAFVIATPVSVVSGITSAAKNGVLIKGGTHLEAMGAVGTVAFDKTGTLTTGELAVTDVIGINGNTEADVLRCARGLEQRSEHPPRSAASRVSPARASADGWTVLHTSRGSRGCSRSSTSTSRTSTP